MKKIILILSILTAAFFGMTPKVNSQVSGLNLVSITPNSPTYHCGEVITLLYTLDYTMQTGSVITLPITYDNTQLQLLTFTPSVSGLFLGPVITGAATNTYQTNPFSSTQNNFSAFTEFTVSFSVINCSCPVISSNIVTSASTSGSDVHTITTPISIFNQNSGASVSMDLIAGSDCSAAVYKITSAGNEAPGNGSIDLTMPAGVTLSNVYNTNGAVVPFTSSGAGPVTYSWFRNPDPLEDLQIHYVMVVFNPVVPCSYSLDLLFHTFNICSPYSPINVTASRPINCCGTNPPPCPTCPLPQGGGILIPGGGEVTISKWLVQTPFRYLPSPDNCMTHDYFIKIDNMSNEDLTSFRVEDLLDQIGLSPTAISVQNIQVSLSPIGSLGPPSPTFDFTVSPTSPAALFSTIQSPSLQSIYAPSGYPYPPDDGQWQGGNPTWDLQAATLTNVFPKWTSLLIKITHRLNTPLPPSSLYTNKVNLYLTASDGPHNTFATYTSIQDSYDPVITIDKEVKLTTQTDAYYTHAISVNPGEITQFRIRIRNYGMADVPNAVLNDAIANSVVGNFSLPDGSSVSVSGSIEYSAADLAALLPLIAASVSASTATGFSFTLPHLKPAPCPGFAELDITYNVPVSAPAVINCNSDYMNTATLNWIWTDINNITTNHTASDQASANIDLFKNIWYKLEATCDSVNHPWLINNINGVTGHRIWYKATVKNNNTYPISYLKMMLQLPSGTGPNVSTHSGVTLTTIPPALPIGTGLVPAVITYGNHRNQIPNGWLNAFSTAIPFGIGDNAIYQVYPSLPPGGIGIISYYVIVPSNMVGSQYNTSLGLSISSHANCPIVRKTDLNLTISASNACDTLSNCHLIEYDKKIEITSPNNYKVSLSNIINAGGLNISNMNIVVHEPYKNCVPWTSGPYSREMVPYDIGPITVSSPYTTATTNIGQRYYTVTNMGSGGFGNVTFNILTTGIPPTTCPLVFPINVVFKDSGNVCTLCEKTFYFYLNADNTFSIQEDQ